MNELREILFRGQTRKKGEKVKMQTGEPIDGNWVYGGIFAPNTGGDFAVIYGKKGENNHKGIQCVDLEKFVVYRGTVGQFTGLTDIRGTFIFEGDIFKSGDNHQYVIFNDGEFMLQGTKPKKITSLKKYVQFIEIIGNIHDNPELLMDNPKS